jgi:hypothetical protein
MIDDQTAGSLRPWFPDLDFSGVRLIHRGSVAWFVRTVLRQGAMTIAPYIFFGRHRYQPGTAGS